MTRAGGEHAIQDQIAGMLSFDCFLTSYYRLC